MATTGEDVMRLLPLLPVGGALGGASSWPGIAPSPIAVIVFEENWEVGRIRLHDGSRDRVIVVQLQCNGVCAMRISLVDVLPAG